tara:strand:+ start:2539 stop:2727 length:189 start_codon:yes stop_codon:yes gene_type:complete
MELPMGIRKFTASFLRKTADLCESDQLLHDVRDGVANKFLEVADVIRPSVTALPPEKEDTKK